MTSVREQFEAQRTAMAPEIQALLDVSDEGIGHLVEFSGRWGVALRAVLDKCDEMEHDLEGKPSFYGKAIADTFRAEISSAITPKEGQ